jgi:thiamine transport system substrate-binding protein
MIGVTFMAACSAPEAESTESPDGQPEPTLVVEPTQLTVMTHDSFAVSDEVLANFESSTGIDVEILFSGDTGSMVNQAVLSRNNPLADVMYGIDNTILGRALNEGLFVEYQSPQLENIPDHFELDATYHVSPVDYGDVCLNYDITYFEENGIPAVSSLDDLLDPAYQDLLVVENPATSSPGLAFLLLTINNYGQDGYLDYWAGLNENGLLVVNDWESAYHTEFSANGGTRPVVVSYGSSPPFEVLFAEEPVDEPTTAAVFGESTCFRQIEFVGILDGTEKLEAARQFVDFMLSVEFQEDIPGQMFVFPVNEQAQVDEIFQGYLPSPDVSITMDPSTIDQNRAGWIETWTDTILR